MLAISNVLLITYINRKKSNLNQTKSQKSKQRTVNRTVIGMTVMYMVMTIPGTITAVYYGNLIKTDWGTFVLYVGDSIDNSYHGLNFLILLMTNRIFLNEAKRLFFGDKTQNQSTTMSLNVI